MTRRASGIAARNCAIVCGFSLLGSTTTSCGAAWGTGDLIASSMEAYSATTWYRVASSRRTSPWRNSRCGSISRVGTGFIGILHRGNLIVRKPCVAAPGSELLHKPTVSLVFFMSPAFMSQDRASQERADRRRCSGSHELTITPASRKPVPGAYGKRFVALTMVMRICGILPSEVPSSPSHSGLPNPYAASRFCV